MAADTQGIIGPAQLSRDGVWLLGALLAGQREIKHARTSIKNRPVRAVHSQKQRKQKVPDYLSGWAFLLFFTTDDNMSTLWNKLSLSMVTNLAQAMRKCKELAGPNFRQNGKQVCNVYDRFVK